MFLTVGPTGSVRAGPSQGLASMADRLIGQHHHEARKNCWHGSGCIAGLRRLRMHDAYLRRVASGVLPGRRPGGAHGGNVHVSGGVSDLQCGLEVRCGALKAAHVRLRQAAWDCLPTLLSARAEATTLFEDRCPSLARCKCEEF